MEPDESDRIQIESAYNGLAVEIEHSNSVLKNNLKHNNAVKSRYTALQYNAIFDIPPAFSLSSFACFFTSFHNLDIPPNLIYRYMKTGGMTNLGGGKNFSWPEHGGITRFLSIKLIFLC